MSPREAFCGRCGASMYAPPASLGDRYETRWPGATEMSAATRRTAGIIVVAILNLILAGYPMLIALSSLSDYADLSLSDYSKLMSRSEVMPALALLWFANGVIGAIAGLGVLKLAPWGKTTSLVFAGANVAILLLIQVVETLRLPGPPSILGSVNHPLWLMHFIGYSIYCGTLIWLFQKPTWKQAFSRPQ